MSNEELKIAQDIFEKEGFVVLKNILNKDQISLLLPSFFYEFTNNKTYDPDKFDLASNCKNFSGSASGYILTNFLKDRLSAITKKDLAPTYTFYRIYLNQGVMRKHIDRPSCEYSITLCIDKKDSHPYPIFFNTRNGKEVGIELDAGDCILYKGGELHHWRDVYDGERHIQIFLHFVDKNGKFYNYKSDSFLENISSYS